MNFLGTFLKILFLLANDAYDLLVYVGLSSHVNYETSRVTQTTQLVMQDKFFNLWATFRWAYPLIQQWNCILITSTRQTSKPATLPAFVNAGFIITGRVPLVFWLLFAESVRIIPEARLLTVPAELGFAKIATANKLKNKTNIIIELKMLLITINKESGLYIKRYISNVI